MLAMFVYWVSPNSVHYCHSNDGYDDHLTSFIVKVISFAIWPNKHDMCMCVGVGVNRTGCKQSFSRCDMSFAVIQKCRPFIMHDMVGLCNNDHQ